MSPEKWEKLKELLAHAMDLPRSARTSFVRDVCGSDEELHAEVLRLMSQDDQDHDLSHFSERTAAALGAESSPRFARGDYLAERFQIVKLLSRGGMGEVYEAVDQKLGGPVALKAIRPEIAQDDRALGLFKQEIQMARLVTHPNVCRIYDLVQHEDTSLLSMELLVGETLAERLAKNGPMMPEEALPLIEQMSAALQAAHEAGVIHHDFKPSNVMLTWHGDQARAVVMDFGLAVSSFSGDPDQTGRRDGTLNYMAPEQLEGGAVTSATDIYALGLVIREMVGPRKSDPPAVWKAVLDRCQQQEPALRFRRAAEVAGALRVAIAKPRSKVSWKWFVAGAGFLAVAGWFAATTDLRPKVAVPEKGRQADVVLPVAAPAVGGETPAPNEIVFAKGNGVLLDAFENRTGEAVFDGVLKAALTRELSTSGFIGLVGPDRIDDALRLMRKTPGTPIDLALAREVSIRDGGVAVLVTGRSEKVPDGYRFTVELVDPVSGRVLDSHASLAPDTEQVLTAVRPLGNWVREHLGERRAQIKASNRQLEKASTPSLAALELFTEADAMAKRRNWGGVVTFAQRALAEDPNMASAHLWLAWAEKNTNRTEWTYEIGRARELEFTVTDRERLFIEGSFHMMNGREDLAIPVLETLTQGYPDHYFGFTNLANAYQKLGRQKDAVDTLVHLAELRPNDYQTIANVATKMYPLDTSRAVQYARRASVLMPAAGSNSVDMVVLFYPFLAALSAVNPSAASTELQGAANATQFFRGRPELSGYAILLCNSYLALGQVRNARRAIDLIPDTLLRDEFQAYVSYMANDLEDARRRLTVLGPPVVGRIYTWMVWARVRPPGVEAVLAQSPAPGVRFIAPFFEGEVAMSEGRTAETVAILTEGLDKNPDRVVYGQHAVELLAEALGRMGDHERAIALLKPATDRLEVSLSISSQPALWTRNLERLLQHYRATKNSFEARLAEVRLRLTLAKADADFYLLKRL